jgi:LPS sulfotransferase NodH
MPDVMPHPTPSFFVVGADRSGTTLLRLMINAHPRLSVGPETWFFLSLIDAFPPTKPLDANEVERAIRITLDHERFAEYPVTEEAFRAAVEALDAPTPASIFACLPRLVAASEGKTIYGDKSPGYSACVIELAEAYPDARFIHITRDARDVALSLVRVGWYGGTTWRATRHWLKRVGACERARAHLGPQRMIRIPYEDLVLETEATLRQLCAFIGVEFDAAMLAFHESSRQNIPESKAAYHQKTARPPSPRDVDVWRRDADRRLLLYVEGGAAPLMRAVGQEPSLTGVSALQARLMWGLANIRMRVLYPMRRRIVKMRQAGGASTGSAGGDQPMNHSE